MTRARVRARLRARLMEGSEMGRPAKTAEVIRLEGKSHRTKKELATRQQAEDALLTGQQILETADLKKDKVAHKEFLRIRRLLRLIKKDDELYGAPARRYCVNASKLKDAEDAILDLKHDLEELKKDKDDFEDKAEYYRLLTKLEDSITKKEQLSQGIRREMTDFEKENCMTIRSSIRTIPKKPETKTNALREALGG